MGVRNNVQVIEIDPDGRCRYVFLVMGNMTGVEIEAMRNAIGAWWHSDDPVLFISAGDKKITLTRLKPVEESGGPSEGNGEPASLV